MQPQVISLSEYWTLLTPETHFSHNTTFARLYSYWWPTCRTTVSWRFVETLGLHTPYGPWPDTRGPCHFSNIDATIAELPNPVTWNYYSERIILTRSMGGWALFGIQRCYKEPKFLCCFLSYCFMTDGANRGRLLSVIGQAWIPGVNFWILNSSTQVGLINRFPLWRFPILNFT